MIFNYNSPLNALANIDFFSRAICSRTVWAASLAQVSFSSTESRMRTISCCSVRVGKINGNSRTLWQFSAWGPDPLPAVLLFLYSFCNQYHRNFGSTWPWFITIAAIFWFVVASILSTEVCPRVLPSPDMLCHLSMTKNKI